MEWEFYNLCVSSAGTRHSEGKCHAPTRNLFTAHSYVTIAPLGAGGHTQAFAEASASSWGDQALIRSAKALAMTAVELLTQAETMAQVKAEHDQLVDPPDATWRQQRFFNK